MTFRFARHTNNLEALKSFYTNVLGLEILGGFEDHDGYDGVFLGKKGTDWHLEFTQSDEKTKAVADDDDLLVFYPENKPEYELLLQNIKKHNVSFIPAKNPYWNENGKMLVDPDGCKIVISSLKIQ